MVGQLHVVHPGELAPAVRARQLAVLPLAQELRPHRGRAVQEAGVDVRGAFVDLAARVVRRLAGGLIVSHALVGDGLLAAALGVKVGVAWEDTLCCSYIY